MEGVWRVRAGDADLELCVWMVTEPTPPAVGPGDSQGQRKQREDEK